MVDRVQVIKWESPTTGGTQTDTTPTEINPNEDGLEARSYFLQDDTSSDKDVEVSRDSSGNMTFKDKVVTSPVTLDDLNQAAGGGITPSQHQALRQLIHFIDDGPAQGFASGCYREILPAGNAFPTNVIWWETDSKLKKIVEIEITRSGGGASNTRPTPIVWKMYDVDGSTVIATVQDDIVYQGSNEASRTRTIS